MSHAKCFLEELPIHISLLEPTILSLTYYDIWITTLSIKVMDVDTVRNWDNPEKQFFFKTILVFNMQIF